MRSLKALQYVNGDNTGITLDGITTLKQAIPKCRVHFQGKIH